MLQDSGLLLPLAVISRGSGYVWAVTCLMTRGGWGMVIWIVTGSNSSMEAFDSQQLWLVFGWKVCIQFTVCKFILSINLRRKYFLLSECYSMKQSTCILLCSVNKICLLINSRLVFFFFFFFCHFLMGCVWWLLLWPLWGIGKNAHGLVV